MKYVCMSIFGISNVLLNIEDDWIMEFFLRYVILGIRFCDFVLDRVVVICKYVF